MMIRLHLLREPVWVCGAWSIQPGLSLIPPLPLLQIAGLDAACIRPWGIHLHHDRLTISGQGLRDRPTGVQMLKRDGQSRPLHSAPFDMMAAEVNV
jgi:hypothetical protein